MVHWGSLGAVDGSLRRETQMSPRGKPPVNRNRTGRRPSAPHTGQPGVGALTVDQVAVKLNVTRAKVMAMLKYGDLKGVRVRRAIRIPLSAFRRAFPDFVD